MGTIFVVLAYYSDGSDRGADTVLCSFVTREAADRFVELATLTNPSKQICVVEVPVEPNPTPGGLK